MEFNLKSTLRKWIFRSAEKPPLTGNPPVRRLKTYSAQSGYVYQYFYLGHREAPRGAGTEFVFQISADTKTWSDLAVVVSAAAVRAWEHGHERELSSTERYAVAKIALFQAFDEHPIPAEVPGEVLVRSADIEGIVEALGL